MDGERHMIKPGNLEIGRLRSAVRAAGLTGFLAANGTTSQAFASCWFCTTNCVACTSCVSSSGPAKGG